MTRELTAISPSPTANQNSQLKYVRLTGIQEREPFKALFHRDGDQLKALTENMKTNGFDASHPLVLWEFKGILIDGHTRLEAARTLNLGEVPVVYKSFENEEEAIEYAVFNQIDRRNLKDDAIFNLVEMIDERWIRGRKSNDDKENSSFIRSRDETAYRLKTSSTKVQKIRTILDSGDEMIIDRARKGKISINKAYLKVTADTKAERENHRQHKRFNPTNESIEWAKWSWNPVVGCRHNCNYCYARDLARRFLEDYNNFEPRIYEERLKVPSIQTPKGNGCIGDRNVFVCSMADLFGNWVEKSWIDKVLDAVQKAPEWNFLFLTKNPKRLVDIEWPLNAWVGTTVDRQSRVSQAEQAFKDINATVKFVSCEPLLEELKFSNMSVFNWLIVGGRSKNTQGSASQPDWSWVDSLYNQARDAGLKVYFKPNLTVRPMEYPNLLVKDMHD